MKRHLLQIIVLVTFIFLVSGAPTVRAETDPSFFKISCDEINMTCTITGYNVGLPANVDIPNTINGYTVVAIGNHAFDSCTSLSSITIPTGVTTIGAYAFDSCTTLISITIPTSVTAIGIGAFYRCSSLISITIPTGVTTIRDTLFGECTSLSSITIPSSVTTIEGWAFFGCASLSSITIPSSVTMIGDCVFDGCTSLSSITIPSSVTTIGAYAFELCTSLTSITIPSSVTTIGEGTFYYCTSLKTAYFKGNAPNMGMDVFKGCANGFTVYYRLSSGAGYEDLSYEKVPIDDIAPVLSSVTPTVLKAGNPISAVSNETGALYLVPKGSYADKTALDGANPKKIVPVTTADTAVSIDTGGLPEGTYQVYAVNNTGYPEAVAALGLDFQLSVASADIKIVNVPVIDFIRPINGATLNINTGSTVIAKIYDIGTGIDTNSVTIQIDNGVGVKPTALVQTDDGYTLYYVITNINYGTPDNSHMITVTACDSAGGTSSASVTFTMELKRKGFGFGKLRFE